MRLKSSLKINLNYLKSNWEEVCTLTNHKKILFMVKANAYGHGLKEISQYVCEELKAEELGVASLGEGIYLRENLPDSKNEIYVFSDTNLNQHNVLQNYLDYRLIPVIHNLNDLQLLLNEPKARNIPLVLKFNTGMNRLGINLDQTSQVIQLLKQKARTEIHHLMTHFAESYFKISGKDLTSIQYEKFKKIKDELTTEGIKIIYSSCANSGAIEQKFISQETHVRPGLMMYGPSSLMDAQSNYTGKNISEFVTEIIEMRKVNPDDRFGYGSTRIGEKGMLAILPIGYGDGMHTLYSGTELKHLNFPNKIVGRINMDLTFLFIPESHVNSVKIGQQISIWTHQSKSINDFANQNKTHAYQIFCGISSRIPRVYLT
jgi:alanine racemase